MNETEFTELLNLYLDHEISAADAARLESEIRSNLQRRRVYLQYCRMQQACRVIASDFAAAEESAASTTEKKVVAFTPAVAAASSARGRRIQLTYAVGACAAAACLVLVFVGRGGPADAAGIVSQDKPVAELAATIPVSSPTGAPVASALSAPRGLVSFARPTKAPTLFDNPLLLTGRSQAEALLAASVRQADNQLAWLGAVQLAPLPERRSLNSDLHFSARFITEGRMLGSRAPSSATQPEPGEEMVTFQFVK